MYFNFYLDYLNQKSDSQDLNSIIIMLIHTNLNYVFNIYNFRNDINYPNSYMMYFIFI